MSELTQSDLTLALRDLGVERGDVLLLHSAYKSLGGVEGGPATVIEALLEVLGLEGTLIAPTFNFGFCAGEVFDVRDTPSRMGAITELVRTDPRAHRVRHPIYSFAVIGERAGEAAEIDDPSSYGAQSLFGKLREWDGKIMVIGLSYNNSMTFFHHVEEIEGCDYRYVKEFTGTVVDEHGSAASYTASMYVRDMDAGVITAVDPMGRLLEEAGAVQETTIGSATARLMRVNDVYDLTAREVARGGAALHRIVSREEARQA